MHCDRHRGSPVWGRKGRSGEAGLELAAFAQLRRDGGSDHERRPRLPWLLLVPAHRGPPAGPASGLIQRGQGRGFRWKDFSLGEINPVLVAAELLDTFCKCIIKSSWKQTLCLPFVSGSVCPGCGEHLCVSRWVRALGPSRACRGFKTGPHAASVTWFSSRHCSVCCDSVFLDDVSQTELRTPAGTGLSPRFSHWAVLG